MRFRPTLILSSIALTLFVTVAAARSTKGPRRIDIAVESSGFSPERVEVKRREPVLLVFTRKTDQTCAKKVVVHLDGDRTVERDLPLGVPVEVPARFARTGELHYTCAMNMLGGIISVR